MPAQTDRHFCVNFLLLEPLGQAVTCKEKVNQQPYPAGGQHQHAADDFSHKGDGLLENVKDSNYREDYAYDINKTCHIVNT